MKKRAEAKMCKRCNRHLTEDDICQSCKSELINQYEASLDWQIAFEIEKAQLTALRYNRDISENEDY
jgi:hypothetical protein